MRRTLIVAAAAMFLAGAAGLVGLEALHYSSSTDFCTLCHEMRVVAEQGWMRSPHYSNNAGVVAQCSDCHLPPETDLADMIWVKTRDGVKDVYVHALGESKPDRMDWDILADSARKKILDSSCRKCHMNLTAGLPLKSIMAHREYERMQGGTNCVDCHRREFHGGFREYLMKDNIATITGGNL